MIEMEKTYNPRDFEEKIYRLWEESGKFRPSDSSKKPFVVVIPPPNVTGILHMGHGLNNSLQDILVRYHRMLGEPTLWVPGTDHAGIATQNVVERQLKKEGMTKDDLGREAFLERTWKVKEKHHEVIVRQLKKIGCSCDWSRERFTMDDGLSRAVREVFVSLYERGLIYRGEYLVNYCTSCGTALADDEVEHEEEPGKLYRIRYPYSEGGGELVVATTRPETLYGDTAVAVHPEDPRYADLIGKTVVLPLTGRSIPVIADGYVDREFGSGAVKITPAHDPNDWEIGVRHDLPRINLLTPDGRLNENAPAFVQGKTVAEARGLTVEALKREGFFIDAVDLPHQVGHCYRCHTIVEPYMSNQWFVKMKPLAQKALTAWESGDIRFFPKKWENTYRHWLENIRDWCISRQLWWGHRIPVWYCRECGKMTVSRTDIECCPECGSAEVKQDEDVLDTWFSSWLWPFSTLGWPEKTADLQHFYPTSVLVTAYDIIFFWVSRMIMAGLEFMGEVPFKDIYIHQLVRDKQGRKMSKSLGNGIDPLEIVEEYGADALKFTLAYMSSQGQDILIDKDSFKIGAKFANKIWNASRYILSSVDESDCGEVPEFGVYDSWIETRLHAAAETVGAAMRDYKFNEAAHAVYEYFWNDFCDWYIEISKLEFYGADEAKARRAKRRLLYFMEKSLRLMHPFLPFITEEIYAKLPPSVRYPMLIDAPFPSRCEAAAGAAAPVTALQEAIRAVRTARSEFTVPPETKIRVAVRCDAASGLTEFFKSERPLFSHFVKASDLTVTEGAVDAKGAVSVIGNGFEVFIYIRDAVDAAKEAEKMRKEIEKTEAFIERTKTRHANGNYLSKAPRQIIEKEKASLEEAEIRLRKLKKNLELFGE